MSEESQQQLSTTDMIAWFLGLSAGLTALLYLAGLVAVIMRLMFYQLPFEEALAELPQNYLVTVAFTEMLLPSMGAAGLYLLYDAVRYRSGRGAAKAAPKGAWKRLMAKVQGWFPASERGMFLAAILATLGWAAVLLYYAVVRGGDVSIAWGFWFFGWVVAVLLAAMCYGIGRVLPRRHPLGWVWLMLLFVLAVLPYFVAVNSSAPLEQVMVCPVQQGQRIWLFIGETNDRIWVGDMSAGHHRVAWLALKDTTAVRIGRNLSDLKCTGAKEVGAQATS